MFADVTTVVTLRSGEIVQVEAEIEFRQGRVAVRRWDFITPDMNDEDYTDLDCVRICAALEQAYCDAREAEAHLIMGR